MPANGVAKPARLAYKASRRLAKPARLAYNAIHLAKPAKFSELRSCEKVEVNVLGSPSLTVRTVSVDVKRR